MHQGLVYNKNSFVAEVTFTQDIGMAVEIEKHRLNTMPCLPF